MNLKNKKVIVMVYQTYNHSYYQLVSNMLDRLIRSNNNIDFDLIEKFLKEKNISFFAGYLDDQKDLYFLNDLYEDSYYRIVFAFDQENKLIDNKIFFDLMKNLKNQEVDNDQA